MRQAIIASVIPILLPEVQSIVSVFLIVLANIGSSILILIRRRESLFLLFSLLCRVLDFLSSFLFEAILLVLIQINVRCHKKPNQSQNRPLNLRIAPTYRLPSSMWEPLRLVGY